MKESQIVRQILDYLAAERIFAFRLNTSATKVGNRFFRAHSLGAGAADIFALRWGCPNCGITICGECHKYRFHLPVWIECKTGKGRQSPEQKSFQEYVESLGHRYILARSVDDVAELWEASKR